MLVILALPLLLASCGLRGISRDFMVKQYKAKLDSMLPKAADSFNLGDMVISVSSLIDPETDRTSSLMMLKRHISELKTRIADEANPEIIVEIMNRYFFEEQMYRFHDGFNSSGALPEAESIQRVMENKKGICLSISILYLITGQALGYEMKGVIVPGHIYVRYVPPGRTGINVETTSSGMEFYDYKGVFGIEFLDPEKSVYGREADNYTVLGAYLNNIGRLKLMTGKTNEAEALFLKSTEMAPKIAEAWQNLGVLYLIYGDYGKASATLYKALDVMPNYLTYAMLGYANEKMGNSMEAGGFYAKAYEKTYGNTQKIDAVKRIKDGKFTAK